MRTIACDATTFELQLPGCADDAAGSYSASLTRGLIAAHTLDVTVLDPPTGPPVLSLALPDQTVTPLKRGVWTLSVKTPCGCYSALVFAEGCRPPALGALHTPAREPIAPTPVQCGPDLQHDLEAANPVLGVIFARSSDDQLTGIDLQADPPYGEFIEPPAAPALTATAINAEIHGLSLVGTLAPLAPSLNGAPWTLRDRDGRTIANGVLTVVGGVGTLTATLAEYLGCGPHTLAITGVPL